MYNIAVCIDIHVHVHVHVFCVQVLDMCAAPGSKTAQLIEMIHADDGSSPTSSALPGAYMYSVHVNMLLCPYISLVPRIPPLAL